MMPAVYYSTPRGLPVLDYCPICDTIRNTSLQDCPRIQDSNDDLVSISFPVGIDALSGLVGVLCEGKTLGQHIHIPQVK